MQLRSGIAVAVVRPAATAPIGHLAWRPPYAAGAALKRQKTKKKKKKKKKKSSSMREIRKFYLMMDQITFRVKRYSAHLGTEGKTPREKDC